jgi:hypothetical protein
MNKTILTVLGFILIIGAQSKAQTLFDESVKEILSDPSKGEQYLIGYTQPLATTFGTIMATGLFHRARVQTFPHFDVGITYIYLNLPENSKTFNWDGLPVPTALGTSTPPDGIIPGTGISVVRVPQLQLNLGLTADIEVMLRTWPVIKVPELGDINLSGLGIKYGLSDLVTSSEFPMDLSVQATYHLLSLSNWVDAGTFAMNIHSSKDIPGLPIGVYTGLGYEVTSMTMRTDDIPGIGTMGIGDVKVNGQNGLRFVIGLNLNIWIFTMNADYEVGYYNAFAAGLKIVI